MGCDDRRRGKKFRGFPMGDWKDEQRTPRGDIKYILLTLLAEQPRHGYELIKELEARYAGFWKPSPGSVYPTLQLLEEGGYLISEQVQGKRVYTITDAGQELLAERGDRPTWMNRREQPQELMELQKAMTDVGAAVMQVARSGNSQQIARVKELLNRVRREVYGILAEDDSQQ
ncbi:hypothetical protein IJ00_25255 [Calothrix sp. 336/3]|nr:hypothetical protein IJ00_25255 [Calothrix sp. 336/3]